MKQSQVRVDGKTIAAGVAKGDESAFACLVQQYSTPLYRFLYRMVSNAMDAEDLTQETFHEIFKRRKYLRVDTDITPYLYTIAKSKAISLIRWRKVRSILIPLTGENTQSVADTEDCGRTTSQQKQVERKINETLSLLKPDQRAAVILRFFENLPYEDVAKIMNKPLGTVKSLVFRAERELRKHLEGLREELGY